MTIKKSARAGGAIAFVLCATAAIAAPRGDTDGNGTVALAEFQAFTQKRLLRADSNSDSRISLDEWKARPTEAKAKRDPAKMFGRLDKNDDGFLETTEMEPMIQRRFERLDANADGALSEEELSARRKTRSN
jgi:Ca2+-binding EF-hand superfamily protein